MNVSVEEAMTATLNPVDARTSMNVWPVPSLFAEPMLFAKISLAATNVNVPKATLETPSAGASNALKDHVLVNLPMFKLETSVSWLDARATGTANPARPSASRLPVESATVLVLQDTRQALMVNVSTLMSALVDLVLLVPEEPNASTRKDHLAVLVLVVHPGMLTTVSANPLGYPALQMASAEKTKNVCPQGSVSVCHPSSLMFKMVTDAEALVTGSGVASMLNAHPPILLNVCAKLGSVAIL